MPVNRDRVALLVEALESGEYEQGRSALQSHGKFCCLGVACEVAARNGLAVKVVARIDTVFYDGETGVLPDSVIEWYGFDEDNPFIGIRGAAVSAISANDYMYATFPEIAQGFRVMYLTDAE